MTTKATTKPTYEYGRLSMGLNGNILFFPKVRVLPSGARKRVGKYLTVNENWEAFLNAALHLASRDGVRIKASVTFPRKSKKRAPKARKR